VSGGNFHCPSCHFSTALIRHRTWPSGVPAWSVTRPTTTFGTGLTLDSEGTRVITLVRVESAFAPKVGARIAAAIAKSRRMSFILVETTLERLVSWQPFVEEQRSLANRSSSYNPSTGERRYCHFGSCGRDRVKRRFVGDTNGQIVLRQFIARKLPVVDPNPCLRDCGTTESRTVRIRSLSRPFGSGRSWGA